LPKSLAVCAVAVHRNYLHPGVSSRSSIGEHRRRMGAAWMLRKIPFSSGRKEAALLCVFFSVPCWLMELSRCALLVVMGTPGWAFGRSVGNEE
jgi:hypothetical protein